MSFLDSDLAELESRHLRRTLRVHSECPGREIEIGGRRVLNFSSNNYLGIAGDARLAAGSRDALPAGCGSTASRLVTGNLDLHEKLEASLAKLHHLPAARLFGSGYQANLGLISALASSEDLIVSDRLNHASIIDGIRLSKATCRVAEHRCLASVREHLLEVGDYRRRFVVTDSIFSMDGDSPDLVGLRGLCDELGAFLIVDEAHASGCMGVGAGLCFEAGIVPDALTGGLGKAFGSYGGYVAGSSALVEYLLNRARSFVFSTALPPAVVGASLAAVRLVSSAHGAYLRQCLSERVAEMRQGLRLLERLEPGAGTGPIFPLLVGDPERALSVCERLLDRGVFCQAIRPPTVESGKSRLRIALSAVHTAEDVRELLDAIGGTM